MTHPRRYERHDIQGAPAPGFGGMMAPDYGRSRWRAPYPRELPDGTWTDPVAERNAPKPRQPAQVAFGLACELAIAPVRLWLNLWGVR